METKNECKKSTIKITIAKALGFLLLFSTAGIFAYLVGGYDIKEIFYRLTSVLLIAGGIIFILSVITWLLEYGEQDGGLF